MDRFAAIEAFVAVVEAGSFVRASERLNLSTTSVSRLVSALEAHLNARLLHRTTRRLSLTDAGRSFYQHATDLLAELAEAEAAVSSGNQAATGLLRVTAPVSFGILHLAPLLAQYHQEQPAVTLDMSLDDKVIDLVEVGRDLAIRVSGQLPASSLVARALAPVQLVVCAAPDYLERHGVPTSPDDLVQHHCLLYSYAEQPNQWSFKGPNGIQQVSVNGFLAANNGDVLRSAALSGDGVVMQPSFIVGDDLLSGRLVPLLLDYSLPPLTVYAIYPSRRHLPGKVRSFVDFLAATWGANPPWHRWLQEHDCRR